MEKRIGKILFAALAICICPTPYALQFDALVVLKMPSQVEKGGTVTVGAINLITDLSSASSTSPALVRDSLHFGFALPAGWSLVSVSAYPAFDFRPSKASVNRLDTNYRNQLMLDSLNAYASRAESLKTDAGLPNYVKGRTYRVHASPDSLGKIFVVKADSVSQWLGFSRPINLSIPAGTPPDTILEGNAVKQVPVFIYAVLKVGSKDESVNPVFLSKTGALDSAGQANGTDPAALAYRPVIVGSPVSIRSEMRNAERVMLLDARDFLGRHLREKHPTQIVPIPESASGRGRQGK